MNGRQRGLRRAWKSAAAHEPLVVPDTDLPDRLRAELAELESAPFDERAVLPKIKRIQEIKLALQNMRETFQ